MNNKSNLHHVIIVGGGAGGLELATQLGDKYGRKKKAAITLVDCNLTHLWKPLLHEVAAGSLNSHEDELSYMAQSYWHHFTFRLGRMDRLDRTKKVISLAPTLDEHGVEYIPRRTFSYDTLIIGVGSITNDFNIPGVREHCMVLDTQQQADRFHQMMLRNYYAAHTQKEPLREGQLHIAIAGAGATGVELSAELHEATRQVVEFGLDRIRPADVKITIIEASEQILPALPERLSQLTVKALHNLDIQLYTGQRVTRATAEGFHTHNDLFIPAEIKVWAAGVKAPDFLQELDGLETNKINQLMVMPTLQTTQDENIFAFGDCAACPMNGDGKTVPPRAQAAHQQASLLIKTLQRRLNNESLPGYRYIDYGSLINMSRYSTVGNLMGNLMGRISGNFMIEGILARLVYLSLHKMHQLALHGFVRVTLSTIANLLTRKTRPRMKLH
ncbi:MAG: NAD(P)/FAD-dependent oxidoreductase [Gammaproteobacteria bacterium]|nr:NAD(P)/FAD-dependent oxidoreductase [Gammaproteobacteria bacterium]